MTVPLDLGAAREKLEDGLVEDVDRVGSGECAERDRAVRIRWCRQEGDPHVGPGPDGEAMLDLVVTRLEVDRSRAEKPCRVAEPLDDDVAGVDDLRAAAGGLNSFRVDQRGEHPLAPIRLLGTCIQALNDLETTVCVYFLYWLRFFRLNSPTL